MKEIRRRRLRSVIILALSILVLGILSGLWTRHNISQMETRQRSKMSPVIMIPGSSATVNRFDTLVSKINKLDHQNHSLLKVKVYNNGRITYSGTIRPHDREPFIVVGFENNHDGYANIKLQAKMFSKAFNKLKNRYTFNNFKGIGHSNGGLIYTYFLEHYFNETQIKITRLMTIGSPFNFAEPTNRPTDMLQDFEKYKDNLPSNLTVYSVAGSENYIEDGLVPVSSVEAGKYIFQDVVKHYTQTTVTGKLAQHSALPQNQQVIDIIQRSILNRPQRIQQRANTQDKDDDN
ncbi:MAG: alpha/beta hydrolase [Limosilactobacillus sp.]|uniref:alpha/beta hydrolase n=1 Tax=Limosilactobacillus sp. TaxID=2773925 RepID=UPI0026FF1108|nr:alpha/beta hydrolase [Limosilactobacillus sp.]